MSDISLIMYINNRTKLSIIALEEELFTHIWLRLDKLERYVQACSLPIGSFD